MGSKRKDGAEGGEGKAKKGKGAAASGVPAPPVQVRRRAARGPMYGSISCYTAVPAEA
jgi:hypothetical protein